MVSKKANSLGLAAAFIYLFLISCSPPAVVKRNFTYCYDGQPTGLDSLIQVRGYYEQLLLINNGYDQVDTIFIDFLFYPDGICVYNFSPPDPSGSVKEYIERKAMHPDEQGVVGFISGSYRLFGDTIKMQLINHIRFGNYPTWYALEKWYLIKDRNILIYLGQRSLEDNILKNIIPPKDNNQYLPAKFYKVDTMPRSNTWLKEEKWFRCE